MKFKILALLVFFVVILFVYVFNFEKLSQKKHTFTRNYRDVNYALINTYEYPFVIYKIKVFNEKVYIQDGSYQHIHEIDLSSGKIITSFGQGSGSGPGEFRSFEGWVIQNDTLFAGAHYQQALQKMKDKTLLKYTKLSGLTLGTTYLRNGKFIIFSNLFKKSLQFDFYQIGLEKETKSKIDVNYPKDIFDTYSIEGKFVENDSDIFIYYSARTSFFCRFNAKAKFLYSSRTIDKTAFFKSHVTKNHLALNKSSSVINLNAFIYRRNFYLISRISAKNDPVDSLGRGTIDVYNTNDGTYTYSLLTPPHPKNETVLFRTTILSDSIFLATDMEKIYVFKYKII